MLSSKYYSVKVPGPRCRSVPHLWSLNTIIVRATHCPCHNNINSLPSVLAPDWLSRPRLGCYLRSDWSTPALRRRCSWLSSPSLPPRHFCICTLSVNITSDTAVTFLQSSEITKYRMMIACSSLSYFSNDKPSVVCSR